MRELAEETGVPSQDAVLYLRGFPEFAMGSDVTVAGFMGVIRLTKGDFQNFTLGDGGLHVMALTPKEIQQNIWRGVIVSGQAALLGWAWYTELETILLTPVLEIDLERIGYLKKQTVHIKV